MQDCCFSFKKKTAINAGPVKICLNYYYYYYYYLEAKG